MHSDAKVSKKLQAEALNLEEHYKKLCLPTETLLSKLDEYTLVMSQEGGAISTGTSPSLPKSIVTKPPVSSPVIEQTPDDQIDAAFADV